MNFTTDGNLQNPKPISRPQVSYPVPNFTYLKVYTQDFAQLAKNYTGVPFGQKHHEYPNAVLAEQTNYSVEQGTIARFTRVYVELPTSLKTDANYEVSYHFKEPFQTQPTFVGFRATQAYTRKYSAQGQPIYQLKDIVALREPLQLSVIATRRIEFINLLSPSNAITEDVSDHTTISTTTQISYRGNFYFPVSVTTHEGYSDIVIDIGDGNTQTLSSNNVQIVRTPADGIEFGKINILEPFQAYVIPQVYQYLGDQFKQIEIRNMESDSVMTSQSIPTYDEYVQMIDDEVPLRIETQQIEKFMGIIYRKTDTSVEAR